MSVHQKLKNGLKKLTSLQNKKRKEKIDKRRLNENNILNKESDYKLVGLSLEEIFNPLVLVRKKLLESGIPKDKVDELMQESTETIMDQETDTEVATETVEDKTKRKTKAQKICSSCDVCCDLEENSKDCRGVD